MFQFISVAILTVLIGLLLSSPVDLAIFAFILSGAIVIINMIYISFSNGEIPIGFIWNINKLQRIDLSRSQKLLLIRYPGGILSGAVILFLIEVLRV